MYQMVQEAKPRRFRVVCVRLREKTKDKDHKVRPESDRWIAGIFKERIYLWGLGRRNNETRESQMTWI